MVIAHRGYSQIAQENSLSAFDAAIQAGAKGIECDVRLTKDNRAVVNHNEYLLIDGEKIGISQHTLPELKELMKTSEHKLLTLNDLFEYIKQKQVKFFLEIKSSSPLLAESIIEKIKENNLWEKVHIMGFSEILNYTFNIQAQYPKLKVDQLLRFPLLAYFKKPRESYGIFFGWLDGMRGSQAIFRALFPPSRLTKLKIFLEKQGFKVMGGTINNDEGFKLFKQAGITDIVTDCVTEAVKYFKD
jgi:glycerophosphoryl diester phosphodiesterase